VPPHELTTAVLFLVFNRLDTTQQVFKTIQQAKPPRLYIAADGPKQNKDGEAETVQIVRDFVMNNIDWECEVKTLFRDDNLGCKKAVSGAISWFFENEEMGIILEDDCLPTQSFYWYCDNLLKYYQYDMRVWHISGDNFQQGVIHGDGSYYFSRFSHIWGWATWADRWRNYDVEIRSLDKFKTDNVIHNFFSSPSTRQYWLNVFDSVAQNRVDTWDYQWIFTCWKNNGLSVLPNVNLVKNIGFGVDATHTMDSNSEMSNLEHSDMELPVKHCSMLVANQKADDYTENRMFSNKPIMVRVIRKIVRMCSNKKASI